MVLSFSLFSCATVPEIYLKTNNGSYWKELVKNKVASDSYQNIYRFDKNANMSLIVYGYKSKIKYTLFLMKEHNQAFYYKKFTLNTCVEKRYGYVLDIRFRLFSNVRSFGL